jgi:gliding motility-associated lipoprotein GldH
MKKYSSFFFLLLLTLACQSDGFYKAIEDIKDGVWFEKNEVAFVVDIKDKTDRFDLYYYVRNATQYPYSNLYISRKVIGPDKEQSAIIRNNITLFDANTGEPLGDGLGDIWDHKVLIAKGIGFDKIGRYTFKLRQEMRQDSLPSILSVGISLEKVNK